MAPQNAVGGRPGTYIFICVCRLSRVAHPFFFRLLAQRGILGWSIPIHHYTRDHLSSPITVTAAVLGLQVLVHAAAFWMRNRRQGRDAPNPDAARAASLASSRSLKRQSWTTHRVQVEQAHRFASTATRVGESLISARDDSFTHSTSSPSSASGASAAAPANQPILERLASAPVRMSTGLLVERPVVSGPVPADPTRTTVDNDSTSSHEWMVWRNTLVTMAAWFTILCLLVVFCGAIGPGPAARSPTHAPLAFFVPGEIARVKDDPVIGHGVRLGRQFVPPQTQEILANLFKQVRPSSPSAARLNQRTGGNRAFRLGRAHQKHYDQLCRFGPAGAFVSLTLFRFSQITFGACLWGRSCTMRSALEPRF